MRLDNKHIPITFSKIPTTETLSIPTEHNQK